MEQLENIIRESDLAIARLAEETDDLLTEFWREQLGINKTLPIAQKSILGCRMKNTGGGLYIQWFWNTWRKVTEDGKEKLQPFSNHISIGKKGGCRYSDASLTKYAKDWEKERVLEVEAKFAEIRKMARHIVQARKSAREALKLRQAKEENSKSSAA